MIKRFFYLLFLFACIAEASAQTKGDEAVAKKRTVKPKTDLDQRFFYIEKNRVSIWGQRAGILINNDFSVGVGGYFSNESHESTEFHTNRHFVFGTGYYEKFIFRQKYWEFSVPFELGFGRVSYDTTGTHNIYFSSGITHFIPTGAGLSLSLKLPRIKYLVPLSWLGINFLAGYRYCLFEKKLGSDYNGVFWSIGGAIFLDRIVDDTKAWRLKRAQKKSKIILQETSQAHKTFHAKCVFLSDSLYWVCKAFLLFSRPQFLQNLLWRIFFT